MYNLSVVIAIPVIAMQDTHTADNTNFNRDTRLMTVNCTVR